MTTTATPQPEPWLRGTHSELPAVLRAVLHAFELAQEDVHHWTAELTEADLHSDEFEMMVCASSSRLRYSIYIGLLCLRRLRGARHLTFLKTASIYCEPSGQATVYTQVDGEPLGRLPAEFRIVPDALTLAVPDGPAGKPR